MLYKVMKKTYIKNWGMVSRRRVVHIKGALTQTESSNAGKGQLFSDITQMVNGAASALGGVREELKDIRRNRTDRSLNEQDLVTREDFDALVSRIEALAARIAVLESQQETFQPKAAKKKAAKAAKTRTKSEK